MIALSILAACSDSGIEGSESQTQNIAATPISSSPSLSAAQLAHDKTVTVQTALALAASTESQNQPPLGQATAAVPDEVNPLTPVDTTGENDNGNSQAIDSSTDGAPEKTSTPDSESSEQNGSGADTEQSSEELAGNATVTDESSLPETTSSEQANESATDQSATSDNAQDPSDMEDMTFFTSVTTPGFTGEVLEDSIKISWNEDPDATGYNVYRQAEYYTTVKSPEFIDTDVFDDDYYYEINAFDEVKNFEYIATGLTVSARTFGRTDPEAPKPKSDLLDDYELVFSDEFTNSVLDTSKWNTSFLWGTDLFINNEEQYYVDVVNDPDFGFNPFSFDGENLTINTIKTPAELSDKALNQPYLSGMITSYDAFKFTYGYTETRAKFTHGRGYWPAFWLLNAYYVDAKPEIDIMEFIGHNQDVIYHTYHYFDSEGNLRSTESFPVPGIDFTSDFHTFGVEWMPGTIIFYVDGIETHRIVDSNVSQQEMYVIANQAVGGWWAGPPDATTPFPGKYVIDYIRVYQRTTPYEVVEFDQSTDLIPLFTENPGRVLPNKRPPIWLWPEGYPDGQ